MRTPQEDINLIGQAGYWEGEHDPLLSATMLLVMYAKGRHKPVMALHKLAKAIERGDSRKAAKAYARLQAEVARYVPMYPDIQTTLNSTSNMTDDDWELIDGLMETAATESA
jgi:hypothetical protein